MLVADEQNVLKPLNAVQFQYKAFYIFYTSSIDLFFLYAATEEMSNEDTVERIVKCIIQNEGWHFNF